MTIGFIYFAIIILANTVGAISGMGGGVIIKPILDLIGFHSVAEVSFYSTVAVFTMSIVTVSRRLKSGGELSWKLVGWVSAGAVLGGYAGNGLFEACLRIFPNDSFVQLLQIVITVVTLLFAFLYTRNDWRNFHFHMTWAYLLCGLVLGFLASFLGIGGGPINVSLLMLLFSMPIKEATLYSLCTIFFSQLSKIITIFATTDTSRYDFSIFWYVIPAAIIGGLLGAKFSNVLSPKRVTLVFQVIILLMIGINLFNGVQALGEIL